MTSFRASASIGFVTFFVIGLSVPAHGQVAVPDVLATQFDDEVTGMPLDLTVTRPVPNRSRNFLTLDDFSDITDRTRDSKKGVVDNFHDNGRTMTVGLVCPIGTRAYPKSLNISVWNGAVADRLYTNEGNTLIDANGNLNQRGISVFDNIDRRTTVRLDYGRQDYAASGDSNIYANVFTEIFPNKPEFTVHKSLDTGSIDVTHDFGHGWRLEGLAAHTHSPGYVGLFQVGNPSTLAIPVTDSGWEFTGAIARQLTTHSSISAYLTNASWTGNADVTRENQVTVGQGQSRRNQSDAGIGWNVLSTPKKNLTFYYEKRYDTWLANGLVPSGGDIGLPIPFVQYIYYAAGYTLNTNVVGCNYTRQVSRNQKLAISYQWVQVRPFLDFSYRFAVLFASEHGQTDTGGKWERAHNIKIGYTISRGKYDFGLHLAQLIPGDIHHSHRSSGSSTGSSSPTRTTDGGRLLALSVTRWF